MAHLLMFRELLSLAFFSLSFIADRSLTPGQWLRMLREQRGLRIKDVENASGVLARIHKNDEFRVPASRLSEIENRDLTPNIYKLYSLAAIYQVDYSEILKSFGVDPSQALREFADLKRVNKAAAQGAGR